MSLYPHWACPQSEEVPSLSPPTWLVERMVRAHLHLLQHRFISLSQTKNKSNKSALSVAQTGRAGCALLQAAGAHMGAFGAVNPASGLVANSRGVGEEEQLGCLQPSQLCAAKVCMHSATGLAGTSQKPVPSFCRDSGKHCCLSIGAEIPHYPWSLTSVALKWTSKQIHIETARDFMFAWFWYKTWKSPQASWQCLWRANLLVEQERASSY